MFRRGVWKTITPFNGLEVEGESWRITVQLQHEVVFLFVSPSQPPSPPCGCSRTHCTTSRAPRTTVTLLMNFSITALRAGDTVAVVHGILFHFCWHPSVSVVARVLPALHRTAWLVGNWQDDRQVKLHEKGARSLRTDKRSIDPVIAVVSMTSGSRGAWAEHAQTLEGRDPPSDGAAGDIFLTHARGPGCLVFELHKHVGNMSLHWL